MPQIARADRVSREELLEFLRPRRHGIFVTRRKDGSPQLSPVSCGVDPEGRVVLSTYRERAKTRNARRDGRVSLHVSADDFWSYVVLEGDADLTPVAADPHDVTVDELVELYRAVQGEHPDWEDYRASMVADQRLVLRLRPTHAYGMAPRS